MKGFDSRWVDLPDYILGITAEIWEGRETGPRMKEYYAPEVIVRTPGGVSVGEEAATRATVATLQEFPDRVLLGEDVIWSGTPEAGMLSSHRILSMATHAGDGLFGPASGRRITWRAIADCFVRDNLISDEWLVRDNGAVVRQLGHDPGDWAKRRVAAGQGGVPLTAETDVDGPYRGKGNDDPWGARLADILVRIMGAEFSAIPAEYDRACQVDYAGGVSGHGRAAADRFWLPLRAAFPSAAFTIDHAIGREDPLMPPRAAVRWSLTGRHDGWGAFGAPTGADVHVLGITHAEFGALSGEARLRREWTLFDETAVWTQIAQKTG